MYIDMNEGLIVNPDTTIQQVWAKAKWLLPLVVLSLFAVGHFASGLVSALGITFGTIALIAWVAFPVGVHLERRSLARKSQAGEALDSERERLGLPPR